MTQLILSNEYLCVIFTLFGEKKFLFKQNICMLFKCSIDTETAHQLLSNYSQMTSCIEFINLSSEPIQNNFNITLRILQNMYLFLIEVLVRVSPQNQTPIQGYQTNTESVIFRFCCKIGLTQSLLFNFSKFILCMKLKS